LNTNSRSQIFKVDEHVGIAISGMITVALKLLKINNCCDIHIVAGLTADARSLCKLMRTECLEHHYVYESPMPVQRLVLMVADKCQVPTPEACTQIIVL
jgi:20S proteasome subunit alpha 6